MTEKNDDLSDRSPSQVQKHLRGYPLSARMHRSRTQAVTPAIATMILLSTTLVLALVFGAYSFGFLGVDVKKITLRSAILYDGITSDNITVTATSSLRFELNNPGEATNITSLTITEEGLTNPVSSWSITPNAQPGNSFFVDGHNLVSAGQIISFTVYPVQNPSVGILTGQTFDYTISFADGQSLSGSLVA